MHLLIDSDSLLYKAGFVCNQPDQENLACWQLDVLMKDILETTGADTYQCYLSGGANFRYDIYPLYKGNRVDMVRPIHLQALRQHLVEKWGATITDGIEADDAVVIAQYAGAGDTAIAHIDKDIDMAAGKHYNFTKKIWYDVSEQEGMRWFFHQLILGDKADNIPGFDGKMRPAYPKKFQGHCDFINESDNYDEMLAHVMTMYGDWDKFNTSAGCLWMLRKEDDDWTQWQNKELVEELKREFTTEDYGQQDDSTVSLGLPCEQLLVVGRLNTDV